MHEHNPEGRALQPLWMVATGATAGAALVAVATPPASPVIGWTMIGVGLLALFLALQHLPWWPLWLVAGLLCVGGRAVQVHIDQQPLRQVLEANQERTLRARMTTANGWSRSRWGWRSRVTAVTTPREGTDLHIRGTAVLEVRGPATRDRLPGPGSTVESLVTARGTVAQPVLVASGIALLETVRPPHGVAGFRDRLARGLLSAAGTDVDRIRAAKLAATVALGRRELMPEGRRVGWRTSGLAHMLAVSGLHVGLLGGAVWMAAMVVGMRPRWARVCVLVALPSYAILSGASPSAVRAALMGTVYVVARLLGRAVIPMAAVLAAATGMLVVRPDLVGDVGFQLTVLITAALVRWAPVVARTLPGPTWLSGAVTVPIVAQIAASPMVGWHFRTAIPGAAASNLLVPWLLAPTLLAALGATALAPFVPWCSSLLLECVTHFEALLWIAGTPGRAHEVVIPAIPIAAIGALILSGWLALQPGRLARLGGMMWIATLVAVVAWWWSRPPPKEPRVELLPVADGLAAMVADGDAVILFDGGRWRDEAAQLLADRGAGILAAIAVSHSDEDHLGGVYKVVAGSRARSLLIPSWMATNPAAVDLLRSARRTGTEVIAVSRGCIRREGSTDIEVLWPPARPLSLPENERSLVVRLRQPSGVVLIMGDIGATVEYRLSRQSSLTCDVLVVPHHGSRGSCSSLFLAAANPDIALIPAGPRNIHHHPHQEVLDRLAARSIDSRYPARDGWCGARHDHGKWIPFP